MKSKALIIVLTFTLILFIAPMSFATNNEIKNGISNVTDTMVDGAARLGNDVKNGIEDTANSIENGAQNLGDTMSNSMQNMDNSIMNNESTMVNDTNSDYNAVRTASQDTASTYGTNSNVWTWVAIAVAGIVIVGLVWYYAIEHDMER